MLWDVDNPWIGESVRSVWWFQLTVCTAVVVVTVLSSNDDAAATLLCWDLLLLPVDDNDAVE